MSFENQVCKICGKKYHCCSSCDNWDTPWRDMGYCSDICYEKVPGYHVDIVESYREALKQQKEWYDNQPKGKWVDLRHIVAIKKLKDFVKNMKNIPEEYAKIINDNFWELL